MIETAQTVARDLSRFDDQDLDILDAKDGTFVRSFSDNRKLYKVTLTSCECKGFEHRGHCKHHAGFVANVLTLVVLS